VRTGGEPLQTEDRKVRAAMELLVLLLFFVVLAIASLFGWTKDSRDSADWKPSESGRRRGHPRLS
jgi:hypothetical protein